MLTAAIGQQDSVGIQFFESKVRPILVEHCYQCHSAGSKPVLGGFKLDTKAGLLADDKKAFRDQLNTAAYESDRLSTRSARVGSP